MPKRRVKTEERDANPMEDLLNNLGDAEEEVKAAAKEAASAAGQAEAPGLGRKRAELLRSSEEGDIIQSVKYLKKASTKVIENVYTEYEARRLENANQFLTELAISKFTDILGG